MSRAGSAKRSVGEAPTLNGHGWLLWGLAGRMAARTSASGPSLGSLRQRRHGSYAGPSPALHTPCSHARQTPPAAASTAPVPPTLSAARRLIFMPRGRDRDGPAVARHR